MSQAGVLDVINSSPTIPTTFDTDSGSAIPVANTLDILGTQGITTSGAGKVVTVTGVLATAGATVGASTIGMSAFDSADFTVTAGFVQLISGPSSTIASLLPDSGTSPVDPSGVGQVSIIGSGSTTTVGSLNTLTVELTGLTDFNVLVGAGTSLITKVAPSATTGIALVSAGAAANPVFGTVEVPGGGTGSTSFTAGSVIFSNGTILTQDNSNFFWDDTNNRLGIGTTTPLDSLHVVDGMNLVHVAAMTDDHAFEMDCDAAGFGDVKALDINYITGAIGAGDDAECMLVNIDESLSTGGEVTGYEVIATAEGSATIHGYTTGININPILHNAGVFSDADDILNKAVDVTAALASGGAGNISAWVSDNDTFTIGDAAKWNEHEFILGTGASGAGIGPTWEFSTGGSGFTAFAPADGTNGFRNSGAVLWIAADLIGWATNTSGLYEIRITRTRNSLSTTPILDEVQISATTEFFWNKDGDVDINSLTLATDLSVANGGTGASTLTGVLTGNGTSAVTGNAVTQYGTVVAGASNAVASVGPGTSGYVLTSAGAGANPAYAAPDLFHIETIETTSATSIDFTTGITGYTNYVFFISVMGSISDGVDIDLLVSTDTGSTFLVTGYFAGITYNGYDAATWTNANTTAGYRIADSISSLTPNVGGLVGAIYFSQNVSSNSISGQVAYVLAGDDMVQGGVQGRSTATGVDAFRFIASTNNIAGNISLFGIS